MTEEKQGAAEWLRGIVDESYGKESRPLCPGIADTFFGIECREMHTCGSCILAMLTAIADRIDAERALPEGIEWPRFEYGELVKVGDEVEFEGEAWEVDAICFDREEWSMALSRNLDISRMSGSYDERVKRPTPKVLGADGVPIEVGDTVYCDDDPRPLRVIHISDSINVTTIDDHAAYYTVKPPRLTHERPDSWERIEEDAKLAPRDYLEKRGMNPEKTERVASMMADLVRRAKALAKAASEARGVE